MWRALRGGLDDLDFIRIVDIQHLWRAILQRRREARAQLRRKAAVRLQAVVRGRLARKVSTCMICMEELPFAAKVSTVPAAKCHRTCSWDDSKCPPKVRGNAVYCMHPWTRQLPWPWQLPWPQQLPWPRSRLTASPCATPPEVTSRAHQDSAVTRAPAGCVQPTAGGSPQLTILCGCWP